MQPPLAAWLSFEVLYHVGNVGFVAYDTDFRETMTEEFVRGVEGGLAELVFLIAGRFADQYQRGRHQPFAEHGLCRVGMGRTCGAFHRRGARLLMVGCGGIGAAAV